jgi:hypothetical protein
MKAVLEFSYPEDERKLLYALRGHEMYVALSDIHRQIQDESRHEVDPAVLLTRVWGITDAVLKTVGDI